MNYQALSRQFQRRTETVGVITGSLCFPLAFFGRSLGNVLPAGAPGIILPLLFFSGVAGAIACWIRRPEDQDSIGSLAPRLGIRAGLIAALVGGALTVLAATLHAWGLGQPPEGGKVMNALVLALPNSRPYQVLIITLMGIPPSIFFSMAAALITAMLRNPYAPTSIDGQTTEPPTIPSRSVMFKVILLLSLIGYLSPFCISLRPKAKPVVIPVVQNSQITSAPPPPKWHYQKPPDFDSAETGRIGLADIRYLNNVETDLPVAISPDGHFFAFCSRENGISLNICDLDTMDIVANVPVEPPSHLTWAPDSHALLFTVEKQPRHLMVLNVINAQLMALPQPKNQRMPDGIPVWWEPWQILFQVPGETPKILDLDNLRVFAPSESPAWKALSQARQETLLAAAPSHLAENSRWRMKIKPAAQSYEVPLDASSEWPLQGILRLSFADQTKSSSFHHPVVDLQLGDSVAATFDGTKFIRVRNKQAAIFYFGLHAMPSACFSLAMPNAPDASLTEVLAKKTLCAFICAPMINPLNGKTVGPDRARVKAVARFSNWSDQSAKLWMEDQYYPVQSGDVVADLFILEGGQVCGIGELGRQEWFTVIDRLDSETPPPHTETVGLDHASEPILKSRRGLDRIESYGETRKRPSQTANLSSQPINNASAEKILDDFLEAHHFKSSLGDVNGLISDYADRVDHFDHGIVDREFVRKDELEYHSPGTRIKESIVKRPVFRQVASKIYSASYTVSYERVRADGRWMTGLSDIDLQIEITSSGPRIILQRAKGRNQQKGP